MLIVSRKGCIILASGGNVVFVVNYEAADEIFHFSGGSVGRVSGVGGGAILVAMELVLGGREVGFEHGPCLVHDWQGLPFSAVMVVEAAVEQGIESTINHVRIGNWSIGVCGELLDFLDVVDEVFEAS